MDQVLTRSVDHSLNSVNDVSVPYFLGQVYDNCFNQCQKMKNPPVFSITVQDLIDLYHQQDGQCAMTGTHLTMNGSQNSDHTNLNDWDISLDRIDSSQGYTKDNIQLVGMRISRMKSGISNTEFMEWCTAVVEANQH